MTPTVVIPVLNQVELTWQALHHIPENYRVILVDDGSDDATPELAPFVDTYIQHEVNRGPHAAWKTGLAAASDSPLTFVINNDVLPTLEAFYLVADAAILHGFACASQMERVPMSPKWLHEQVSAKAESLDTFTGNAAAGNFWAVSARFRDLVEVDDSMRMTHADIDFLERLKENGATPVVVPNARVYHMGSHTRMQEVGAKRDTDQSRKDFARFAQKWGHRPDLVNRHRPGDYACEVAWKVSMGAKP